MVILQLIHVSVTDFQEGLLLPVTKPTQTSSGLWVSLGNNSNLVASASGASYKCLTYQLSTVGYWPTVAMTGNGELGFDSSEAHASGGAEFASCVVYQLSPTPCCEPT